jgi:hypothetical protein
MEKSFCVVFLSLAQGVSGGRVCWIFHVFELLMVTVGGLNMRLFQPDHVVLLSDPCFACKNNTATLHRELSTEKEGFV